MPRKERLKRLRDDAQREAKKADPDLILTPEDEKTMRADIKSWLEDEYKMTNMKHVEFYVEFIQTSKAYRSYQKVFGSTLSMNVAAVQAHNLMKKYKVSFIDWLDHSGHGPDSITKALDKLLAKDPDAYLKHITKLKQLDNKKIELSGSLDIPNITITTEKVEDE